MMPRFPFPLEEVPGDKTIARWRELRALGLSAGFYPVVVGDFGDTESLADAIEANAEGASTILDVAGTLDGKDVLREREEQEPELMSEVDVGDWPDVPARQPIVTHTDLRTGVPKKTVFIAKLPVKHSYEVFAVLGYGGWNDCPGPAEHVAVQRMWHERYGAEIIAVTGDVVECVVSNPPKSREAAMALAKEQFCYCTDIVYQGVQTLSALAAGLQNHDAWFFWWD